MSREGFLLEFLSLTGFKPFEATNSKRRKWLWWMAFGAGHFLSSSSTMASFVGIPSVDLGSYNKHTSGADWSARVCTAQRCAGPKKHAKQPGNAPASRVASTFFKHLQTCQPLGFFIPSFQPANIFTFSSEPKSRQEDSDTFDFFFSLLLLLLDVPVSQAWAAMPAKEFWSTG